MSLSRACRAVTRRFARRWAARFPVLALAAIGWMLTSLARSRVAVARRDRAVAAVIYAASAARRGASCARRRSRRREPRTAPHVRDSLLQFRAEFPILERTTYLVSNSLGAMPRAVPERLAEYVDQWAERGVRAWADGWWEMPVSVGDEIAPLIGAPAGEVAMLPERDDRAGVGAERAELRAAARRDRDDRARFSRRCATYTTGWRRDSARASSSCHRATASVSTWTACSPRSTSERRSSRCRTCSFARRTSSTSRRSAARAREVGARVSLDAFHSVGVMPVDVTSLGVDFLSGGVLKWLCGGPGGAFLYASPEASRTLTPAFTGWQAHERPFGVRVGHALRRRRVALAQRHAADSRAVRRGGRSAHRAARRHRRHPREEHSSDVAI